VAGHPAHADSTQADALDKDGKALMARGEVARACEAFEASNRVDPSAGTLIHLGFCREQNGQLASASRAYQAALARAKDRGKQELAAARAAALASRLSHLTVSVPADRIEGLSLTCNGKALEPESWNKGLPVDGGDYVIVAHAPGHADWQITTHVPAEAGNVSVEVPRFEQRAAAPAATPAAASADVLPAGNAGGHKAAIAIAVVGVVGLGVGTGLAIQSRSLENDADKLCPGTTCTNQHGVDLNSAARRDALLADIAVAAGGAAIVGATVLWLTASPRSRPTMAIVPILDANHIAVSLARRF
jgi:hypothetical protein